MTRGTQYKVAWNNTSTRKMIETRRKKTMREKETRDRERKKMTRERTNDKGHMAKGKRQKAKSKRHNQPLKARLSFGQSFD